VNDPYASQLSEAKSGNGSEVLRLFPNFAALRRLQAQQRREGNQKNFAAVFPANAKRFDYRTNKNR